MAKKQLPRVSVVERRLKNPFGSGTVPITLKSEGQWAVRIVYSKLRSGHLYNMVHHKGWEFVTPDEIDGTPEEYGLTAKDNRLVRGDHGEEVLMKMRQEDFDAIQKAKQSENLKGIGQKAMAEYAAQRTAKEHGSEAGDTVFNAFKHGEIKDSRGIDPDLEQGA